MHLLSAKPGSYVEGAGGVTRVEQTAADIVVLSAADTVLALLSQACEDMPADFPSVRLCNLMHLRQAASIDLYVDQVLRHAKVVIIDHLGGESYWAYGTERLVTLAAEQGQKLLMFSGDHAPDENLLRKSTASPSQCTQLWRYLRESGPTNALQFFRFIGQQFFALPLQAQPPQPLPAVALYWPSLGLAPIEDIQQRWLAGAPVVAIVFYRAHLAAGNTAAFDQLIEELTRAGLSALPVALDSLKTPLCLMTLRSLCAAHDASLILNTTAFSVASVAGDQPEPLAGDIPVLQLIMSGGTRADWAANSHGLSSRDVAMQVALPEVDGRIIARAVTFKGNVRRSDRTQSDVVRYEADMERMGFIASLARRWCELRRLPNNHKRVALILANYPGRDSGIGNAVGLDTPASTVGILNLLKREGFHLDELPPDGRALFDALLQGVTNDADARDLRPAFQSLSLEKYEAYFSQLPAANQEALLSAWGAPCRDAMLRTGRFMIAGVRTGNVFVGIQPSRGGSDAAGSYHSAELVPPHHYLAFYFWLREVFSCHAIVHVGTHGNLEWLPGKSIALSAQCWPDVIFGPMPHLYPFIVNDPGEGSQAKRRTQAVIVDHLMPPLTRADSYGPIQALERQVDEYYEALILDARRAALLREGILKSILDIDLHRDMGLPVPTDSQSEQTLLRQVDAYLCDLKESQIRDGLHIFGRSPEGQQRSDTLLAMARFPVGDGNGANAGLLTALARDLELDGFNPLSLDASQQWLGPKPVILAALSAEPWRHGGDTRERLEKLAAAILAEPSQAANFPHTQQVLLRVLEQVAPALDACGERELAGLRDGLNGRFVAPGPSGAPSRGRPDVLPTGRNFFSVDTRAVPTPAAWHLGFKSAALLIERYLQEHGDFPRSIGLSVWGSATMRTGGDDIAQALALLGVRPVWSLGSQRVADFEILPLSLLDRPRIDVTLRVSGLFRDAFAGVIDLFDAAVQAIAALDESNEQNPVRARIMAQAAELEAGGMPALDARRQAGWRVFSSRPGTFGVGLQELINTGRWGGDGDLAEAYLHSGRYAYGQNDQGTSACHQFQERLAHMDAVLQNQDNAEHDLLDSSDYFEFQGGMTAASRHYGSDAPTVFHVDHSNPIAPTIRTLSQEISRVVRARVINPKWITAIKRHGYRGAMEIAATVEHLFSYDATTNVIEDYQYALVTDAYVLDPDTRDFLLNNNPQAFQEVCERLLEAVQRGMWSQPGEYRAALEDSLIDCEATL